MPIYEYDCDSCQIRFQKLQSMSFEGDLPCPECGKPSKRAISVFAAVSKSSSGDTMSLAGGGCSSCSGGSCASCGH